MTHKHTDPELFQIYLSTYLHNVLVTHSLTCSLSYSFSNPCTLGGEFSNSDNTFKPGSIFGKGRYILRERKRVGVEEWSEKREIVSGVSRQTNGEMLRGAVVCGCVGWSLQKEKRRHFGKEIQRYRRTRIEPVSWVVWCDITNQ